MDELQVIEQESYFGQTLVPSLNESERYDDIPDDEEDNGGVAEAAVEDERVRKLKNECKYFYTHL